MSVAEIEAAITKLNGKDLARLLAWIEEYYERLWDQQMEEDLEAGRLDKVLAEVDREYKAGLGTPL